MTAENRRARGDHLATLRQRGRVAGFILARVGLVLGVRPRVGQLGVHRTARAGMFAMLSASGIRSRGIEMKKCAGEYEPE